MSAELRTPFWDVAILALLSVWLLLSVIAQWAHWRHSPGGAARWGSLGGLLPSYRFFAPRPVTYDYKIAHRCVHGDGSSTPWRPVVVPPKSPYCWIWNPQSRLARAISDIVAQLFRQLPGPLEAVCRSDPYRVILQHVMHLERGECSAAAQFAIMRSKGFEEQADTVIFVSEVHALDRPAAETAEARSVARILSRPSS